MTQRRFPRLLAASLAVAVLGPATALASWNAGGPGNSYAKALSVSTGNTPTASVTNRSVTVNWTATGGNVPVAGYTVKRFSTGGVEQTVGSSCSGTVSGTTCTETAVPPGSWRYTVTPVKQNWKGAESGLSNAVSVNAPALSLTPTTAVVMPQVLTGTIQNYVPGQTVTFRLDNQTTGSVLTGSITPSPVPANGTATVLVTLPNGVANGSHTIFAIGSGGDVASQAVTVAVPICVPGSQTVVSNADSWVNQASPTVGNGSDSNLKVVSKSGSQNARALVNFALPTIPSGCSLTSATLRLNNKSPVSSRTIQALRINASWTEAGVNWNNQPATTGTAATATTPASAGLMNWTVTSQVQAMYTAGASNGFLLRDATEDNTGGAEQQFDSRESGTAALRPRLIVGWGP